MTRIHILHGFKQPQSPSRTILVTVDFNKAFDTITQHIRTQKILDIHLFLMLPRSYGKYYRIKKEMIYVHKQKSYWTNPKNNNSITLILDAIVFLEKLVTF